MLDGIDLSLPAGQVTGILGANGAGKSSLLAVLAGELAPAAGEVLLLGKTLSRWRPDALARHRALLPQNPSLQFDLPVSTLIGMGAYPHASGLQSTCSRPPMRPDAGSPEEDRQVLARVLALADVEALHGRRYRQLSGGEQQRVQFARVLYQVLLARGPDDYRVLMLDEPTASLDPLHQHTLLRAVRTLAREDGIAVCVVLHDLNLAAGHCDQLRLLAEGRVVSRGTPAEVLRPHTLRQVYGVEALVLPHPRRPDQPMVVFEAPDAGDPATG